MARSDGDRVRQPVDVLVIGSGIAGLSAALKAARNGRVAVVTKKENRRSATNFAQGGIAAVLSPLDDFDSHIQDTLTAGAGLCRREAVERMVRAAPALIAELVDLGVSFSRRREGASDAAGRPPDEGPPLDLGREGGHSRARIVHAQDLTGREVEEALVAAVTDHTDIAVLEDHAAVELIGDHYYGRESTGPEGVSAIHGAYVLDREEGEVVAFPARCTLLATGGCGQVYRHTTNPDIATGDGLAMAARAGSRLADLEFMQFHPTALVGPDDPAFLISEAVRGFGAILRNDAGEAFMEGEHPLGDLAPRDIVARAIDRQLKTGGVPHVWLDLTHKESAEIEERFPHIVKTCRSMGLDPATEMLPVVPAAHYMCGGVPTDLEGRTALPGLFAVGETACTGVHGANRLASNSLLEGLYFAQTATAAIGDDLARGIPEPEAPPPWDPTGTRTAREAVLLIHDREEIRDLLWDYVGLVRSTERLERAERRLSLIAREIEAFWRRTRVTLELLELRNLAQVGLLIARSALRRKESRGLHYVTDHPDRDPAMDGVDTVITLDRENLRP